MDKAHGIRVVPGPASPDDPRTEALRVIIDTARRTALRQLTAAFMIAAVAVGILAMISGVPAVDMAAMVAATLAAALAGPMFDLLRRLGRSR